jgi:hypothetical protein
MRQEEQGLVGSDEKERGSDYLILQKPAPEGKVEDHLEVMLIE